MIDYVPFFSSLSSSSSSSSRNTGDFGRWSTSLSVFVTFLVLWRRWSDGRDEPHTTVQPIDGGWNNARRSTIDCRGLYSSVATVAATVATSTGRRRGRRGGDCWNNSRRSAIDCRGVDSSVVTSTGRRRGRRGGDCWNNSRRGVAVAVSVLLSESVSVSS